MHTLPNKTTYSSMPVALTLWGDYEAKEGQILTDKIHTQPILAAIKISHFLPR